MTASRHAALAGSINVEILINALEVELAAIEERSLGLGSGGNCGIPSFHSGAILRSNYLVCHPTITCKLPGGIMSRTGRILYRRTSLVNTLKKTCMLLLGLDKQIKEQIERVYGLGKCWVDKQLGLAHFLYFTGWYYYY